VAKSVVVTGCGMGIGRAILERVVADGWTAVGLELDAKAAGDAGQAIHGSGEVLVGDVTDREALERAAARARELAPLHGWVNNAGIVTGGALHEIEPADVERVFAVDLFGVFWGCATAVRTFVDQRVAGSIVNISSIHGRAAFSGFPAYGVAKAAVDGISRYVAVEYGPLGIRANSIAPGAIRTPLMDRMIRESGDPERAEYLNTALHPMNRTGQPREIAAVAAFLLSDDASFLSGQSIAVDGASSARCYPSDPHPGLLEAFGSG
jgi:NAD(P)-dependent dehydrogenase (short-subunit alcohol dehydrogenase family)